MMSSSRLDHVLVRQSLGHPASKATENNQNDAFILGSGRAKSVLADHRISTGC